MLENLAIGVDVPNRTIKLSGDLDVTSAHKVQQAATALTVNPGNLAIDCAGIKFLDSAGVKAFVAIAEVLDGRLIITNPSRQALRILDILRASRFISIFSVDKYDEM